MTLLDISERIRLESGAPGPCPPPGRPRAADRDLQIRQPEAQCGRGKQRQRLAQQVRENLVHITQGVISGQGHPGSGLARRKKNFSSFFRIPGHRTAPGHPRWRFPSRRRKMRPLRHLAWSTAPDMGFPGAMVSLMGHTCSAVAHAVSRPEPQGRILTSFHDAFDERMKTQSDRSPDARVRRGHRDPGSRAGLHFAGAAVTSTSSGMKNARFIRGTRESIDLAPVAWQETLSARVRGAHHRHPARRPVLPQPRMACGTSSEGPQPEAGRKRFADLLARHASSALKERKKAIQKDCCCGREPMPRSTTRCSSASTSRRSRSESPALEAPVG